MILPEKVSCLGRIKWKLTNLTTSPPLIIIIIIIIIIITYDYEVLFHVVITTIFREEISFSRGQNTLRTLILTIQ
jgi:hypothetical protein